MIVTEGLSKVYPMGGAPVRALRDVTLRIAKGEFVAVTGPSGSGKSTFLNLVGCLDPATSGSYLLDGTQICGRPMSDLAALRGEKIGFVFQSFQLLDGLTALENVELPLIYAGVSQNRRAQRALAALEQVGLKARAGHLPGQLSGGQQQRVAIARALVRGAPLLLADEPTGNLDSASGRDVMELLLSLNRTKTTIVLITHDPAVAARAGRVLRIRDGRLEPQLRTV